MDIRRVPFENFVASSGGNHTSRVLRILPPYRLPCLTPIKDVLRSRDVFLYHLRSSPYFVFLCLSRIERTQIIGVTMSQQHNEEVIGKSEIVHIKYSASRDADQLSINEVALGDNLPQGYYYSLPFIGTLLVS